MILRIVINWSISISKAMIRQQLLFSTIDSNLINVSTILKPYSRKAEVDLLYNKK